MNSGYISVVPEEPACWEPKALVGGGFTANANIDVYTTAPFEAPLLVFTVHADANGGFIVELPERLFADCSPGRAYAFLAGPSGTQPSSPTPWPRAVVETEPPGSLVVTPTIAKCGEQLMLSGDGFPPGSTITLMLGSDDAFAHNFVRLGTTVADETGQISTPLPMDHFRAGALGLGLCPTLYQAIYAHVDTGEDGENLGRWQAPFVILP